MTEKISVIVPVYNIAEYLARCLDSILNQTYRNLEIIVVNDGSTDRSAEILNDYACRYPKIKVIHKDNGGVTSARLCGVAHADGEWIGFVDGDDKIDGDMYERLIENAHTHDAQISHCGYQMHFDDGRIHYFYNTGLLVNQDKTTALQELLSGERIEPGLWNKLFHKSLFHSSLHDRMLPDIRINEDLLMNYYLFSAAEITVYEDRCPYHYMIRSTSASRAKLNENKLYDPIRVREQIRAHCPEALRDDAERGYIHACLNACNAIAAAGFSRYQKELLSVRTRLKNETPNIRLLRAKRRMMVYGVLYMPRIYSVLYFIYTKYFQKKRYE